MFPRCWTQSIWAILVSTTVCFTVFVPNGSALDCKDINKMTQYYLRMHFSIHKFSDEIGNRTLNNMIKQWDPGKVYFLQEDIDRFASKGKNLPRMIGKTDCSLIDLVFAQYSKRLEERFKEVGKLIDSKHDFSIDEYLNIDRKATPYAKTKKEVGERWRKRIKFQHMQLKKSIDDDKKVREKLHKRYELAHKRHIDLNTDDVYGVFIDSFATALDPHTDYFSPSKLEEFRITTRLSLEGIGALLRSEDGVTSIQSLVPGGAAQKTGTVKVDDKIVAVSQGSSTPVDVIDMDLKDVVKLIRGPGGTEVKLHIRRGKKELVSKIVREKIQLADRAAKSSLYNTKVELPGKTSTYKVGVIDLPSFYMDFEGRQANKENFRSSSRDMNAEITKLKKQKVDGIVVDLRSNGGGSLDEAINVAGLFSGAAPVVQIKGSKAKPYVSYYDRKAVYDGPLVVMVDRQSASASEILAGAIKDYERGIIVGDSHTFGKGTVQNLNDLDPKLGAIKVTISKFYRPGGSSTQLLGVESDIVLPSITDYYEIGEKHYDYAIPWEKVPKAKHPEFKMVSPYIKHLKLASTGRVKGHKDFREISQAIDKYKSNKEERMRVSLKEPTKEEREKEEKEEKEQEELENSIEKDAYGNIIQKLENDIFLQEAINIATDYIQLIKKNKMGRIKIVELEERKKTKGKAKASVGGKDASKTWTKSKKDPSKGKKSLPNSSSKTNSKANSKPKEQ